MTRTRTLSLKRQTINRRILIALATLTLLVAGLHYAPSAQARGYHGGRHHHHGHWRGGAILGGVIIGSAIARSYYYPYSYYPAPTYYSPPAAYYPPAVVYPTAPAATTYIEQQPNYVTAPIAATPQLPIEQRAERLKAMCDRGLFTPQECATRRQEILSQM